MPDFNVSVASYSFNKLITAGLLDIYGYFDLLKYRYHVDYTDIWTEGCFKSLDEDYIRSVRYAMDQRGLKLANLCVDGPYVWCDDPEERAEHKRVMLDYLKAARTLGAKTIRIDFGCKGSMRDAFMNRNADPSTQYNMTDEAFEYIVNTYKEYCKIVGDWGAKIGPENHWGWDRIPKYLKKVCDAVDDKAYGHLYHLRNFLEDEAEGEEYCIAHAMHTHIHADSVPYAKDVIRRLALSGYSGAYGVEHHSGKCETERVEWHLGSLRAIIAEVRNEDLTVPSEPAYMSGIYSGERRFPAFSSGPVIGR